MKQINMLESPVRQVFFSYLVPSISATLVTSIYILADTMMIGRGVGGSGIAAMNILLPLYNTYFGIGMMCGVGGSVLFGFSRGRGDEKRARSYFTAALCVVLALSAVFLILGRIFFNPLITFMGNTPLLNEYTCLTELCSQQRLPCLPCLHSFRHSSEMTVRRSLPWRA